MKLIHVVIILVLVGAAAFFGGTKYAQSMRSNFRQNFQGNRQFSTRPVNGEIVSLDDKSITVKMPDGQSKIVILSATTQINQTTKADKTDLKEGSMVAAFGSENSDGSLTAQNIELNPQFGRFRGPSPTPGK